MTTDVVQVHELTNPNMVESLTQQANALLEKDYPAYAVDEPPEKWIKNYTAPEGQTRQLLTVLTDEAGKVVAFTSAQIYPSADPAKPSHQALMGYTCADSEYVAKKHERLYKTCQEAMALAAKNIHRGEKMDPYHNACEATAVDLLTQAKAAAIEHIKLQPAIGVIVQEHMPEHARKVKAALAAGQKQLPIDYIMPQWSANEPNTTGAKLFVVEVGANHKSLTSNLIQFMADYINTDGCHAGTPAADPAYTNIVEQTNKLGPRFTTKPRVNGKDDPHNRNRIRGAMRRTP